MKKLISGGLSPNLERSDVFLSLRLILSPFKLKQGDAISKVEGWFRYNFKTKYAFSFASARESLYALFVALGIKPEDEIIIQGFTCSAVVYPILWMGASPVYVDIDPSNLSMDPSDLLNKITKKTKAIILQHTFGIPGNIDKVKDIALKKNIFLIEDCAHTIGGVYKNKKLGMFADASIFSFGRDKAISCVFGGVVIVKRKVVALKISKLESVTPFPSYFWIYQQLLHPICTYIVLKCFFLHRNAGALLLSILKKIHLISLPIQNLDKQSFLGKGRIKRLPNGLATIAISQLTRSIRFNKRRREISMLYYKNFSKHSKKIIYDPHTSYLRFPVLSKSRSLLFSYCRKQLIYLGDWYSNVVDPKNVDFSDIYYKKGSCKMAEMIAGKIVNLPTYPTLDDEDVRRVINSIKLFIKNNRGF